MAKRKMEYEIVGKSDVQQVTNRAKTSLSQLDQFTQSVGKKFSEIGKDFATGFLAPMLLLNKAIDYISNKIEEAKQRIKEAREFVISEEGKKESDPMIREFLRRSEQTKIDKERAEKIQLGKQSAVQEFLETTPEGKAIVQRVQDEARRAGTFVLSPKLIATHPSIQDEVIAELRKQLPVIAPEAPGFAPAQGGNVIGVGQSALDMAVGEQTQIQKDILQMLRDHLPQRGSGAEPDLTNKPEPTPTYTQKRSMRIRIPAAR